MQILNPIALLASFGLSGLSMQIAPPGNGLKEITESSRVAIAADVWGDALWGPIYLFLLGYVIY
jgi:hypothetical protein